MVDPEDVEAIALDYAMRDLFRVAHTHADPDAVLGEWFHTCCAVLILGQWEGRSLESLMLMVARRVTADAAAGL